MSILAYDQEARRLAEAYRAVKVVALELGILDASATGPIPSEVKAAMMRWASGIAITLNRRDGAMSVRNTDAAPAALTPATTTKAQREAATASGGPARGDPVDTTAERETFICAKCKKVKYWEPRGAAKGKAPWPGATCFECYKAGMAVKA